MDPNAEMAYQVRAAIDLVLSEFLNNAPNMADARFTIQAAFIICGLDRLIQDQGTAKAAQTLAHIVALR